MFLVSPFQKLLEDRGENLDGLNQLHSQEFPERIKKKFLRIFRHLYYMLVKIKSVPCTLFVTRVWAFLLLLKRERGSIFFRI